MSVRFLTTLFGMAGVCLSTQNRLPRYSANKGKVSKPHRHLANKRKVAEPPRFQAFICKMTDDHAKNNVPIKSSAFQVDDKVFYDYTLIWCTQEKADQYIQEAEYCKDTHRAVFMVDCTEEKSKLCQKHNLMMHVRAKQNDDRFNDNLFLYHLQGSPKANIIELLTAKYRNLLISMFEGKGTTAIQTRFEDAYDSEWEVISNGADIRKMLDTQFFDPDYMIFLQHKTNGKQVVLISDLHTSEKTSALQHRLIEDWKPDAVSLELDMITWQAFMNQSPGDTPASTQFSKHGGTCLNGMLGCSMLGCLADNPKVKLAAAAATAALYAGKRCFESAAKGKNRWDKGTNMMTLLDLMNCLAFKDGSKKRVFLADWQWFPIYYDYDALQKQLESLETDEPSEFVSHLATTVQDMITPPVADQVTLRNFYRFFPSERESKEFVTSLRSDLMYISLMNFASRRDTQRIVGVYGMKHVLDIERRFKGESEDFLLKL